jgi:hypothetical protein
MLTKRSPRQRLSWLQNTLENCWLRNESRRGVTTRERVQEKWTGSDAEDVTRGGWDTGGQRRKGPGSGVFNRTTRAKHNFTEMGLVIEDRRRPVGVRDKRMLALRNQFIILRPVGSRSIITETIYLQIGLALLVFNTRKKMFSPYLCTIVS